LQARVKCISTDDTDNNANLSTAMRMPSNVWYRPNVH